MYSWRALAASGFPKTGASHVALPEPRMLTRQPAMTAAVLIVLIDRWIAPGIKPRGQDRRDHHRRGRTRFHARASSSGNIVMTTSQSIQVGDIRCRPETERFKSSS